MKESGIAFVVGYILLVVSLGRIGMFFGGVLFLFFSNHLAKKGD